MMLVPKFNNFFLALGVTSSFVMNMFSPSQALEIERVKGNCPPLNCVLLLQELEEKWDWKLEEWLNSDKCKDRNTLGLNVWEKEKQERVVTITCWGEKNEDGNFYGSHLGVLPYPGDEQFFGANWNCSNNQECESNLEYIESMYPKVKKISEIKCAIENGELRLLTTPETLDIECVFPKLGEQIDTDADGIIDEMPESSNDDVTDETISQPETVNLLLYQLANYSNYLN